jgi:hypothetical protein
MITSSAGKQKTQNLSTRATTQKMATSCMPSQVPSLQRNHKKKDEEPLHCWRVHAWWTGSTADMLAEAMEKETCMRVLWIIVEREPKGGGAWSTNPNKSAAVGVRSCKSDQSLSSSIKSNLSTPNDAIHLFPHHSAVKKKEKTVAWQFSPSWEIAMRNEQWRWQLAPTAFWYCRV